VFWTHGHRLFRRAGAVAALALFMLGSNFCLVGVLRGAPASCTTMEPARPAPIAECSHCAHRTSGAPARAAHGTAPCCVSLTPTNAPDVPRVTPAPIQVLIGLAVASLDDAPRVVSAHPPLDDGSLPAAREKTVRADRAPPLA
jgi:hypothetical protein